MTNLFEYEVLTDKKNKYPIYKEDRKTIINRFKIKYKWYIEVRNYNLNLNEYEYYLLLSKEKFNKDCNEIKYDDYGRQKIKVTDIIDNEIKDLIKHNNEFNLEYIESKEEYDKYMIN